VVLFVTDAPEEFAAAEAHLTSQGRNAMFCTMEDVLELIERTQSDHIVLTGLFNTYVSAPHDTTRHDTTRHDTTNDTTRPTTRVSLI
jgi:hypothetical protein